MSLSVLTQPPSVRLLLGVLYAVSAVYWILAILAVWASLQHDSGDGPFAEVRLGLPAGCSIAGTRDVGGLLAVHSAGAPGCARITVVKPATGAVVGTFAP